MAEKSPRRLKLEQSLADDPNDPFLRYGLAVQCLREGDIQEGRQRLLDLINDHPDDVAAHQQLGQSYMDDGELEQARHYFNLGIAKAQTQGDLKAAGEMQGFLELMG